MDVKADSNKTFSMNITHSNLLKEGGDSLETWGPLQSSVVIPVHPPYRFTSITPWSSSDGHMLIEDTFFGCTGLSIAGVDQELELGGELATANFHLFVYASPRSFKYVN